MKSTPPIDIIREINTGVYCGGASGLQDQDQVTYHWYLYRLKYNNNKYYKYNMIYDREKKMVKIIIIGCA